MAAASRVAMAAVVTAMAAVAVAVGGEGGGGSGCDGGGDGGSGICGGGDGDGDRVHRLTLRYRHTLAHRHKRRSSRSLTFRQRHQPRRLLGRRLRLRHLRMIRHLLPRCCCSFVDSLLRRLDLAPAPQPLAPLHPLSLGPRLGRLHLRFGKMTASQR